MQQAHYFRNINYYILKKFNRHPEGGGHRSMSTPLNTPLERCRIQKHVILCLGYDMSPFVRRYARYLNEKAFAYRQMAFDFCKVKKGLVFKISPFLSRFFTTS